MPYEVDRSPRAQALLCVVVLLLAAAICHPVAAIGIYDDWSYVRTAQLLAQTGHVHYNGWATAMLGWQLYPAALAFRLFGFSFTIARMTTLAVAAATTYLLHRCSTRLGCRPLHATAVTLTLVPSPLFLPLATTFMSDVFGLFAIVACLYCCVRAVKAAQGQEAKWIAAACGLNVVTGTARQIAWLGLLVMVPSAVWLLRRQRRVVVVGAVGWLAGVVAIFACLRWFAHQPYAVPEIFPQAHLSGAMVANASSNLLRLVLEWGLLLLPLLLAFYPALGRTRARLWTAAGMAVVLASIVALAHRRLHHLGQYFAPTLLDGGNFVGPQGTLTAWPEYGARPTLLSDPLRVCLTLAVLLGFIAVACAWRDRDANGGEHDEKDRGGRGWRTALVLTGPFCLAYLPLLMPRAAFFHPYDRYCLPLTAMAGLLLARLYGEQMGERLPAWVWVAIGVVGLYSVATTHDAFAMYRGTAVAVDKLRAAGVAPTALDAGWDFSGWTQVTADTFVHDLRLRIKEPHPGLTDQDTRVCHFDLQYLFPEVHPRYALAFEPEACGGSTTFPVTYFRTWLPWRRQPIYVVRDAPAGQ